MHLSFDADHLRKLLQLSRKTEARTPILEQVVTPTYWRRDLDKDRAALLRAEVAKDGFAFSARSEDVDPARLPVGLILVGDQGVYIMSQAPSDAVKATGISHVAYAREADPTTLAFDDWWDAKRASFGPDDGTEFLPADMLDAAFALGTQTVTLDVTPDGIGLVTRTG